MGERPETAYGPSSLFFLTLRYGETIYPTKDDRKHEHERVYPGLHLALRGVN